MIFSKLLGESLGQLLQEDPRVILLGEDIVDPYGGAFKVTRGLSSRFPGRVRSTPISESAMVGLAVGLAMEGFRPVVEIMFGDFLTLTFDQILNHATKYRQMYNGQISCPIVVRTPCGGGRAYGPTHSQSLEKYFLGVPALKVVAPCLYADLPALWGKIMQEEESVLFVEHKLMYPQEGKCSAPDRAEDLLVGESPCGPEGYPLYSVSLVAPSECHLSVVAYGYQASLVEKVLRKLGYEEEIFIHLLIPTHLNSTVLEPVAKSVGHTRHLLTVEEGTEGSHWGAGVIFRLLETGAIASGTRYATLATAPGVIPSSRLLEARMLVNEEKIEAAVRNILK